MYRTHENHVLKGTKNVVRPRKCPNFHQSETIINMKFCLVYKQKSCLIIASISDTFNDDYQVKKNFCSIIGRCPADSSIYHLDVFHLSFLILYCFVKQCATSMQYLRNKYDTNAKIMIRKSENFTTKIGGGKSLLNEKVLAAYNDALSFERTVSMVIPAVFAVVIFVGVLGNLSVIAVFSTKRRLHTSTNTLIINLALADLLFLIFCVPFTAADYALPIWVFSPNWCACLFYFQSVTAYASVWTLVLMALDRFFAVVYPIQSITLRNVRNTMAATVTLWLIILLSNLSQLEKFGIHEYTFVIEQR
uniref:G-protein coupled receptors family 1 profile domain-containing protein n=1 Tax=Romanomermis culicivorax TaxID=13658 RepID=A0A915KRQ6_ROMCU